MAKEHFMNRKFAHLLETISSDGSIINTIITDDKKMIYEYPNKVSEVTDCPERAYYNKELLAQRPLSEIDEDQEGRANSKIRKRLESLNV